MRSATSIAMIALLAGPIAAAPFAYSQKAGSTYGVNVARVVEEEAPPPEEPTSSGSSFSNNPIVQSAAGGAAGAVVSNILNKIESFFKRD